MYAAEALSELVSSRDSANISELGRKGWVIANVGKEGSLFGGSILGNIEDKFGKRQIIDPIVLLTRAVRTDVGLQRLIGSFCESVGTRVVSSGISKVDGRMRG